MNVAVWDTYVERENGKVMHFDILVPDSLTDEEKVYNYGLEYLKSKPFQSGQLTAHECRLCHYEPATQEMIQIIEKQGYYIIEMENCK